MEILYQDSNILVINKPSGLSVLPDGWEKDSPYLVKMLEQEFGKDYVFVEIDVDKAEELAHEYDVKGIPLFLFFKNGIKKTKLVFG